MHNDILDYNYDGEGIEKNTYYASFWSRVGATLIDGLVFIPVAFLNVYNTSTIHSLVLEGIIIVVYLLYKPLLEYLHGATLGKMALRMQVVNEHGDPIDATQAIIRSIPYLLLGAFSMSILFYIHATHGYEGIEPSLAYLKLMEDSLVPTLNSSINLFFIVSCLFVAFRPTTRRALHDTMAGTYCVQD